MSLSDGPSSSAREAVVSRETKETRISVSLRLDGTGKAKARTGIGFFDHMLEAMAKHGRFDLTLNCKVGARLLPSPEPCSPTHRF